YNVYTVAVYFAYLPAAGIFCRGWARWYKAAHAPGRQAAAVKIIVPEGSLCQHAKKSFSALSRALLFCLSSPLYAHKPTPA
ncbi:MAG: hypothetical protein ACK5L3_01955, partial [Oscillospiraceae bacterium]